MIFKNLYKNSGREKGTLRYFREKLQRRNVTVDVKHFEDCEQLFVSTGKCFAVEALIQFFNMESKDGQPTQNKPPYHILKVGDNKTLYYKVALAKTLKLTFCKKTETEILKNRSRAWVQIKQTLLLNVQAGRLGVKEQFFKILIRRSGKQRNLLHTPTALQL